MSNYSTYLHAFALVPGLGPSRLIKLVRHFPDPEKAFHAKETELVDAGIDVGIIKMFLKTRETLDLKAEIKKLELEGISLVCYLDDNYPQLLKEITNFPPLLYYKGIMEVADELCVAVVGTRKITNYGRTVAPYLVEPLIQSGVTIVSGLAYGVDSQMQSLAIKNGRRTIAVLGGGLDAKSFYPKEHQLLADEIIAKGGALVSEYPPGTPPLRHHFIARNRILSGLCVGTIVIECSLKSGSLITAQYALEQNRQLYAVPGPIYSDQSKGPNNLVKMGAKLITEPNDVLADLNLQTLPQQQELQGSFGDTPAENTLLSLLSFEPVVINELIKLSGLEAGEVTSALTFLEMKGKVRNLGAQQYIKSR